uniref:Uncharacterized protein n=1 Tax=Rhizophora mucronata TaxID=61149 RepID=A0A2P2QQV5_RHIMU
MLVAKRPKYAPLNARLLLLIHP